MSRYRFSYLAQSRRGTRTHLPDGTRLRAFCGVNVVSMRALRYSALFSGQAVDDGDWVNMVTCKDCKVEYARRMFVLADLGVE